MRIACKGSINYEQHQLVLEIFGLCGTIKLEIEWISRTMNTIADESSKIYDYDDWRVSAKKYVLKKKNVGFISIVMYMYWQTAKKIS